MAASPYDSVFRCHLAVAYVDPKAQRESAQRAGALLMALREMAQRAESTPSR